jgi:diguanylate cyclase (GGDEF)-like protein
MKAKRPSRLAIVDHLTGLYNRRHFDKCLKKFILEAKKKKKHFSLLMIDIDKFKDVNDKYGHLVGDTVLNDSAKVLKASVRKPDICFRYGGDEIAVLLPNADQKTSGNIAVRLKSKVEKYKFATKNGLKLRLKLSIGLAVFPADGQKPEDLIKQADVLLYKVKSKKKTTRKITEPFVLETKLIPPGLKENTISRPKLLSLLKKNFNKKLILIIADAGYGKTTLLSHMIEDKKSPYVFYDLDRSDSDFAVFFSYLMHGFEQTDPGLVERSRLLSTQGGEIVRNYELVMGTLINELVEKLNEKLFIFLDDYHSLTEDSLVHKALDYFIDHLPAMVYVVIASRSIPPLVSLTKWRSKQDLFELAREELRFTAEELKTLLADVYKMALGEDELMRVTSETEGWITGIQLTLQSAEKDGNTLKQTLNGYLESNQPLFKYFANEIFNGEPLAVKDFLLKSSVLDIMTIEACNCVLEIKDSKRLLSDLEKRNLFVYSIGKGEYRYHRLFQQFLEEHSRNKKFRRGLNLKAAKYYQKKGQLERAVRYYLDAESYRFASNAIVRMTKDMVEQARFSTLQDWLQQIPESMFEKQPYLLDIQGLLHSERGDLKKAKTMYIRAEKMFRKQGDSRGRTIVLQNQSQLSWRRKKHEEALSILRKALLTCPSSDENVKGSILNGIGVLWMDLDDMNKARAYLLRAKRMAESTHDEVLQISVEGNLGYLYYRHGEIRLAYDLMRSLIERIGDEYRIRFGIIFANAARCGLDIGQVEWTEEILNKGRILCQLYEDSLSQATLQHGFGSLYIEKAQWEKAFQYLEKSRQECEKLSLMNFVSITLITLSRLFRYRGKYERAMEYLDLARQRVDKIESLSNAVYLAEHAMLEVSSGQFEHAEQTIKKSQRLARKYGWKTGDFLAELARAVVNLRKGEVRKALRSFNQAVRFAKLKGYDGILARELRHNLQLAELAQRSVVENEYLSSINRRLLKKVTAVSRYFLRVKLLGEFALYIDDHHEISQPSAQISKAILSCFLLNPKKKFTWEDIASWVWPESPASTAHQMFRNSLYEIRKYAPVLKSVIVYKRGRYCLNSDVSLWVDVWEFQSLLKNASRSIEESEKMKCLEKAIILYQGDLLPGFYYSWIDDLRHIYELAFERALDSLAEMYFKKQQYEKSITYCLKYLKINELDEAIHRLLIRNYICLGHRSEALRRYEHLTKILGISPSLETVSLIKSMGRA